MRSRNVDIATALRAAGYPEPVRAVTVTLPKAGALGIPATADNPVAQRYVTVALDRECAIVSATPEGGRNDQLNRSAFALGTLVGAGLLDGDTAFQGLLAAGEACGLPATEVWQTATSGLHAGMSHPRDVLLTATEIVIPTVAVLDTDGTDPHVSVDTPPARLADNYIPIDWQALWDNADEDTPWLVYPLFERGRIYALYSTAKAGKSLVMHDICGSLVSGRPILGQAAEEPINVMYVDFENSNADLFDRFTDLEYTPSDLQRLHYFTFPALPSLDTLMGGMHLVDLAEKYQPAIVVIDTTSRIIQGKENDSDTFHALYRYSMMPLKAQGVTVVRLDHSGKDEEKGMRGSSAKVTDVDGAWKLSRVGDSTFRLDLAAQRSSHSPPHVLLEQQHSPLRHVLKFEVDGEIDQDAYDLVAAMDRLGLPTDWGKKRAKAALREAGFKFRDTKLERALRMRKQMM